MVIVKNQLRSFRERNAGFTLIELLVVIIIIGILAGIVSLGFSGARRTAMVNTCKIDWANANSALSAYRNDYPTDTITNLSLYATTGTLITNGYMQALINRLTSYSIILNSNDSISVRKPGSPTDLTPADSSACSLM